MADRWSRRQLPWSRLDGNYRPRPGDENGRQPERRPQLYHPPMAFDENGEPVHGPPPTDRTHQWKTVHLRLRSTRRPASTATRRADARPREWPSSRRTTSRQYRRGSDGRTPALPADLYLQQNFKIGMNKTLQLSANHWNLLNQETAIARFRPRPRRATRQRRDRRHPVSEDATAAASTRRR
jgi:hypothetical protein